MTGLITVTMMTLLVLSACATTQQAQDEDKSLSGGAQKKQSAESAQNDPLVTVKQFVEAHQALMADIGDIKAANQKMQADLGDIKGTSQKSLETAQRSLQIIEEMANRQGTGELTVFFPVASASIEKSSLEFERLVRFADFLSRESRGRKIIFLSIGSASAIGNQKTNLKLAMKRSEAPLDILDKYLINIPHEFHKVYGTGDLHSPKKVKLKEHQRYQHTRIIALFDVAQAPKVNEEIKR